MIRVAAFTRYGARAASTRQRLLQYLPHLEAAGIEVEWHALLDDEYVQSLATGEAYPKSRIAKSFANRFVQLTESGTADLIWIYVELFPYLPAWMEQVMTGRTVPLIYDLDDAFFHQYDLHQNPLVRSLLGKKFESLLRGATACSCGNAYLHDYAKRFCPDSIILPTVVDTSVYRPAPRRREGPPVIGWIGSPSTWQNVRPLLPLLAELCARQGVRVRAVGAGDPAKADHFPGLELVEWKEAAEVAEVQAMDIGIMPLIDRPFERGKSGYKLVQYMACGLPVVASPVGVNREIVTEGQNGFLATGEEEWRDALMRLIADPDLRQRMGDAGRRRAEKDYSLASQAPRFVDLVRNAVSRGPR